MLLFAKQKNDQDLYELIQSENINVQKSIHSSCKKKDIRKYMHICLSVEKKYKMAKP